MSARGNGAPNLDQITFLNLALTNLLEFLGCVAWTCHTNPGKRAGPKFGMWNNHPNVRRSSFHQMWLGTSRFGSCFLANLIAGELYSVLLSISSLSALVKNIPPSDYLLHKLWEFLHSFALAAWDTRSSEDHIKSWSSHCSLPKSRGTRYRNEEHTFSIAE